VNTLIAAMRRVVLITGVAVLASLVAAPGFAADGDSVTWKDGLKFKSADGSTAISIGGRLHTDFVWLSVDDDFKENVGDPDDGTEVRRARLFVSGTLYHSIDFKAQYDFAGGIAGFRDAYMSLNSVPGVGYVRVGQQKEPVGLEFLTGSNYITFMERGVNTVFNPDRNVGLRMENSTSNNALNGSLGVFRRADPQGTSTAEDGLDAAARVSGSPWYAEDGRKALHVGVSGVYSASADDTLRFGARPEVHFLGRLVDTRAIPAKSSMLVNAEAAVVVGSFSAQAEFALDRLDSEPLEDPTFTAWYAYASWFVTGESRNYNRKGGVFKRVKPKNNINTKDGGGFGAWEVAVRISAVDLNDSMASGGEMTDITLGVNWYLNPATRVMVNYVRADVKETGVVNAIQTRFQIDF